MGSGRAEPRPVHIDAHNVDRSLARRKAKLSRLHGELLELYILHLRSEGRSPETQYCALYRLDRFLRWLEAKGKGVNSFSALDVKTFLAEMSSPANKHRYGAVVKGFLRFLIEHHEEVQEALSAYGLELKASRDHLEKVYRGFKARPPRNYPLPEIPPNLGEAVERLIGELPWPYNVILAVIYETGARRGEVLSLRVGDVEDAGDYIRLRIRRSKSRPRVVVVVRYQSLLREWLRRHYAPGDPDAPLFHTRTGKMVRASDLYMRMRSASRRLGINMRIYPHLLRHYRATELYGKLSEKEMMQWFGWSTRYMIDIYSHLKESAAVETILRLHGVTGSRGGRAEELVECPKCGALNPPGARYCCMCGTPITAAAALARERVLAEARNLLSLFLEELRLRAIPSSSPHPSPPAAPAQAPARALPAGSPHTAEPPARPARPPSPATPS